MRDHLREVRRYDALADEEIVARIVKHLGIALRNRDSSLVSCGDDAERERVVEKWCIKKLGIEDRERARRVVEIVCETMQRDRAKDRVAFYYLCAKHLDLLDTL